MDKMMEIANECRRIRNMKLTPPSQRSIIKHIYNEWKKWGRTQVIKLNKKALSSSPVQREALKATISEIGAIDKIFSENHLVTTVHEALVSIPSEDPSDPCRPGVRSATEFMEQLRGESDEGEIGLLVVSVMHELRLFLQTRKVRGTEDIANLKAYCWPALRMLVDDLIDYLGTINDQVRAEIQSYDEYMQILRELHDLAVRTDHPHFLISEQ